MQLMFFRHKAAQPSRSTSRDRPISVYPLIFPGVLARTNGLQGASVVAGSTVDVVDCVELHEVDDVTDVLLVESCVVFSTSARQLADTFIFTKCCQCVEGFVA